MLENKEVVESVEAENTEQAVQKEISSEQANSTVKKEQEKTLLPLEKAIEAGMHLGLKTNKWNPKMKSFIYAKKYNHIIDIKKTFLFLEKAFEYLKEVVSAGGEVMFVGTKNKMARPIIKAAAERVGAFYVTQRWLGGTLTNFKHLSHSIEKLNKLEELLADEELQKGRTKKELLDLTKQKDKLKKFYGGIQKLKTLPNALVIFDPVEEKNALDEAKKCNIPVIAFANTNANPDKIDFIVPSNNFSFRSVILLSNVLADAVALAKNMPALYAYKTAEEIVLPETKRRFPQNSQNSRFSRNPNYKPRGNWKKFNENQDKPVVETKEVAKEENQEA